MADSGERRDSIAALADLRKRLGGEWGGRIVTAAEWERAREAGGRAGGTGGKEGCAGEGSLPGGLAEALEGGPPRGQLTEILGEGPSRGGGLAMAALLSRERQAGRYAALIDAGRGFEPAEFPARELEGLLWVGCDSALQAVEALDLLARDENFGLFLVDLRDCEPSGWRAVRSALWHRILGQLRLRGTAAVLFARSPVSPASKRRLWLEERLPVGAFDTEREALAGGLRLREGAERAGGDAAEPGPDGWRRAG